MKDRIQAGGLPLCIIALVVLLAATVARAAPESFSLEDCIQAALADNPGLEAVQQRQQAAESVARQARALYYPTLAGSATYARTDNAPQAFMMTLNQRSLSMESDFNNPDDADNLRFALGANYLLYDGGRRQMGSAGADALSEAGRATWEAARNSLIHEVTRSYFGVLQALAVSEIQADTVRSLEASRRVSSERLAAGAAVRSDVLNLEVQLAEAQDGYIRASNGVQLAVAALNLMLGAETVVEATQLRDAETGTLAASPLAATDAAAERPERLAAAAVVESRRLAWRSARRAYLPTISAFGSLDWDHDLSSDMEGSYFAGVMAELDLFTGFRRGHAEAQGLADLRAAEAEADALDQRLRFDVQAAELQRTEAWGRMGVARQAVGHAEEALRLSRERYASGAADVVELITAENGYRTSRMRDLSARYDYQVALSNVERARGALAGRYAASNGSTDE